jgi:hypothetical protein
VKNSRTILMAVVGLYGLACIAGSVQAIHLQVAGSKEPSWPDVMFFGAVFLVPAGISFVAAARIHQGSRGWSVAVAVVAVVISAVTLLFGIMLLVATAFGDPVDGYIGPVGGLSLVLGLANAALARLARRVAGDPWDSP